jgi:hypothetical protein
MEAMRSTAWTDDRLDDLNSRVGDLGRRMDNGFNRVDSSIRALRTEMKTEIGDLRTEMKTEIGDLRSEMSSFQRTMVQATVAMAATFVTGFATLAGLIVTQL